MIRQLANESLVLVHTRAIFAKIACKMTKHSLQQQFGAVSVETQTYGMKSLIVAGQGQRLHYILGDEVFTRDLERPAYQMARLLLKQPCTPLFAADIQTVTGTLKSDSQISDIYKELVRALPEAFSSHIIRFGNGKGMQYAALIDNTDVSKVCENGSVRTRGAGITNQRLLKKRLDVYSALERYYENPDAFDRQRQNRKKAIIGTSTGIAVGAAAIVYIARK